MAEAEDEEMENMIRDQKVTKLFRIKHFSWRRYEKDNLACFSANHAFPFSNKQTSFLSNVEVNS